MNKIVLITGSSKGIGKKISEKYSQKGYKVVGVSRGRGQVEEESYFHYSLDVTREDKVSETIKLIESEVGPVYALINNAGTASMNHIALTPGSSSKKVFNVNFHGLFFMIREVSKKMMSRGEGRIVNISSIAKPLALEGEAIYSSSKAAVEQITRVASKELAEYGITVNTVGPTPIKTDLIKGVSQSKIEELVSRQSIERYTTIDDIENVIDFFLREESEFITGQTIYLGGITK